MYLHGSFALLATLCSILVSQTQLAASLPLGPEPKATGIANEADTLQDPKPWLIITEKRLQLPQVGTAGDPGEGTEKIPALPSLFSADVSLSDALQHAKDISTHFVRRADGALGNNTFVTAMFVVLIVVSVLIGAGAASIAVFGLD
jgi:hypothetical protein